MEGQKRRRKTEKIFKGKKKESLLKANNETKRLIDVVPRPADTLKLDCLCVLLWERPSF